MMFGMIPFERNDNNIFDLFDNFQKQFFRNSNATLPAFRADIRDLGDKFVLEAELPGFNKEDISLDLKEGILTVKAEHKEEQEQQKQDQHTARQGQREQRAQQGGHSFSFPWSHRVCSSS